MTHRVSKKRSQNHEERDDRHFLSGAVVGIHGLGNYLGIATVG